MNVHFTPALLREVAAGFDWPAAYTIEDGLPDGIFLKLPACSLRFSVGEDGYASVRLSPLGRALSHRLDFSYHLNLSPHTESDGDDPPEPPLAPSSKVPASAVRTELHRVCSALLETLKAMLLGDFGWLEPYLNHLRHGAPGDPSPPRPPVGIGVLPLGFDVGTILHVDTDRSEEDITADLIALLGAEVDGYAFRTEVMEARVEESIDWDPSAPKHTRDAFLFYRITVGADVPEFFDAKGETERYFDLFLDQINAMIRYFEDRGEHVQVACTFEEQLIYRLPPTQAPP
ncbi:MAG: hypothetical protein H6739_13590 [Alphaproteobacteria bacterium]|nr:hypothetical protein [Alphaproteobacteria bacterium]